MRRLHQFISLSSSVLLSISLFAACGNEKDETITTSEQTQDVQNEVEVTEQPDYIVPEVDYDGEIFNIYVYHYQGAYKICEYDAITAEATNGDIINDGILQRNQAVENALNVTIKAYSEGQGAQSLINSILADDKSYDAALLEQQRCRSMLGGEGYLMNLRDISTLDFDASWVNGAVNETMTFNNQQYVMLNDICMYSMLSGGCLYFSKSLIEANSLDNPYQMVYDGKWTLDNFIGLSKRVSADLNGDGIFDQNDSFGMNGSPTVVMMCVRTANCRVTDTSNISDPKIVLNNEKTINVVDKLTELLSNEQVNMQPDKFKKNPLDDVWYNIILPMFKNNQLLFTFNWVFYSQELRDMETDFGIMPMPKYDENQGQYYSYLSDNWSEFLMVPSTVKNPDMVGNVLNAMGYYSQQILYPEVVNRTVMDKTIRDDNAADMLDIIFRNTLFDANDFFMWDGGSLYNIWANCVSKKENVFASSYAKLEGTIQKNMNKDMEKLAGV